MKEGAGLNWHRIESIGVFRGQRMSGAIPPLPNTPSWLGA